MDYLCSSYTLGRLVYLYLWSIFSLSFWSCLVYLAFSVVYPLVFLLFLPSSQTHPLLTCMGKGKIASRILVLAAGEREVFYDTLFLCNREATDLPFYLHLFKSLFNPEIYAYILGKSYFSKK